MPTPPRARGPVAGPLRPPTPGASLPPPASPPRRPSGISIRSRPGTGAGVEMMFDALADLDHQPDALSAARLCLEVIFAAVPCRALLTHAFDAARGDFVVVHARGESARSMLLARQASSDPLLRIAMPSGEPFAWTDLRKAPVNRLGRFKELRGTRTILDVPIVSGATWLGAFELVDPFYG